MNGAVMIAVVHATLAWACERISRRCSAAQSRCTPLTTLPMCVRIFDRLFLSEHASESFFLCAAVLVMVSISLAAGGRGVDGFAVFGEVNACGAPAVVSALAADGRRGWKLKARRVREWSSAPSRGAAVHANFGGGGGRETHWLFLLPQPPQLLSAECAKDGWGWGGRGRYRWLCVAVSFWPCGFRRRSLRSKTSVRPAHMRADHFCCDGDGDRSPEMTFLPFVFILRTVSGEECLRVQCVPDGAVNRRLFHPAKKGSFERLRGNAL